ncbi:hypothetical protein R52603_03045 [Paraburkholderia saeva]|uniref:DUF898 domain-containing protein n=2 Tax=Paraburkholderia saeva TaxID=2777537 RepID=A0A9N8RZW9_9BURK|nr:hypothetical protein R52603_03045 [Paraburkholderia saeva]CAG4913953.1 hypothetical protein LMG31841_04319 [Paraburkholderia saeva]
MNLVTGRNPLLTYDGSTGALYGIFIRNFVLTVLTLGIYRFWATTNTHRYVWSSMRFQGTRFEYTGRNRTP